MREFKHTDKFAPKIIKKIVNKKMSCFFDFF